MHDSVTENRGNLYCMKAVNKLINNAPGIQTENIYSPYNHLYHLCRKNSFENIQKRRDVRRFKRFMSGVQGNDETACPSPVHMFLLSDSDNRRHFQTQNLQGSWQLCSVLSMFPLYLDLCFWCSFLFPFLLILSLAESPQPAFRQFPPWHWVSGVGLRMWINKEIPKDSLYSKY